MKRAIGYVRVSHQEQVLEGVSLDAQRDKIRMYAELNDFELIGIEADEGISGKSIKARKGIQKVLNRAEKGEIDAIIIFKIDRLARNTAETLQIAEFLDKKGVSLHSISEKLDTKSPVGEFFFTLMASLAQMERKMIGERTRNSLLYLKNTARAYNGVPLYGYKNEGENLIPDEAEQAVVNQVMAMHEKSLRVAEITRRLNKQGHKARNGKEWYFSAVKKIITDAPLRDRIQCAIQKKAA